MFISDVLNVILEYLNDSYKRVLSITIKELYTTTENNYAITISDICNINMFEWALQIGCPTGNIIKHITSKGDLETLKLAISKGFKCKSKDINRTVIYGLDCLKYLHDSGYELDSDTCAFAARTGHLDCLKYAHENGCQWNSLTCHYAASNGHLDCLTYAYENGCPWSFITCHYAAESGHLNCLKYLHTNGCEWNSLTCLYAAKYGHLDCLIYLHESGCEWDSSVCYYAAENNNIDCLTYARANGL